MSKILLVEDDIDLAGMVEQNLAREHATVEVVHTGDAALDVLAVSDYDLLILDWELPGASGIEICKWYRQHGGQAPVLMLTGKSSVVEKETGLDSGADDYLTKPFSMRELSARARAALRRTTVLASNVLMQGGYKMDPFKFSLERDGKRISLQPREFALLEFLMRHPGEVFSPEALLERIWRSDTEAGLDALRACVKRIRKKLDDAELIETVHGMGYRLKQD
ncbi:MAG TPA: response regulator transcription factor [Candidatus Obscuribacterales bacterium]